MIGPFASQESRMRENAGNWIELADQVWNYRRDLFSEAEMADFVGARRELAQGIRENADSGKLKLGIESLEEVLRRVGGTLYPKTSLTDGVDFFLVAVMIILSVMAYFAKPFKIPTNSMWPTYSGMTGQPMPLNAAAPGFLENTLLSVFCGMTPVEMTAPANGTVEIPFETRTGQIAYTIKSERTWLILPTQVREYTFYVDGVAATVTVPLDFEDFDRIAIQTFYPNVRAENVRWFATDLERRTARNPGDVRQNRRSPNDEYRDVTMVQVPGAVRKGAPIVRFELLTGDQLVVDRLSYNFMPPRVGQGFVFRTDHIRDIGKQDFYVKRLIGVPGDKVAIKAPTIYRNGKPIEGSAAFALNAAKVAPYRGYFNADKREPRFSYLFPDETVTVPANSYLALGDNSASSFDGRYWGFVPDKDVIGHPLFIYYPFTTRWGVAR